MYENDLRKSSKKNERINAPKKRSFAILKIIPKAFGLGFRLGLFYLGFKRKARKAGKIFEKELLAVGMDKKMARQLKKDYLETSHFFHQIRGSQMNWD